ncbi:glycolate oxidase iron-sulfur subunit [Desulfobotulus alkaliphilus]|uniref:Glycolate oxidase iron-sulfur subunit n=1 Tax=Desulfobotulus alkaliphilus TaxID=622671 RepID=A0A562RE91_9BACT|nr:(Fe-S)-binding protein [Desulfobotulus alkaliphilus]TWI67223.1 glycolate oxidase iron-sulfur subunit [Desulfobotulus alkaliphilus]
MGDLKRLHRLLMDIDDMLAGCMRCGMCQSVCPVFARTLNEGDVARGKIALLEGLSHQMISDAEGVKCKLDKCLLCGSCSASCPSGVKATDIFLKARAALTEYTGLSPVKKAIFRGTLTHPELFNRLVDMGSKFQGIMTKKANAYHGTSCAPMLSSILGNRQIVPLASKPFRKSHPSMDTPAGKSGLKVAFYPGCLVDKMYTGIGEAVLKVMKHHGVGVFLPANQACCGMPALASGDTKSFEKLVDLNLNCFSGKGFDVLVTPCATCTATLKKVWPMMAENLDMKRRREIDALSAKVMDINQFLVDKVGVRPKDGAEGRAVTFHDPCHLGKSLGVFSQPRTLIQASGRYHIKEMQDANTCCGSGGSFNLQHYETSTQIGQKKRDNIVATQAEIVATGCPACMMQLTDMLASKGDKVRVKHSIELYAETL